MNLSQKPLQLKILGRNVPIHYLSPFDLNALAKDEDILGYFCGAAQAIYINDTLEGVRLQETLYHEVTHAILSFSGLAHVLKDDLEEAICNAIEGFAHIE